MRQSTGRCSARLVSLSTELAANLSCGLDVGAQGELGALRWDDDEFGLSRLLMAVAWISRSVNWGIPTCSERREGQPGGLMCMGLEPALGGNTVRLCKRGNIVDGNTIYRMRVGGRNGPMIRSGCWTIAQAYSERTRGGRLRPYMPVAFHSRCLAVSIRSCGAMCARYAPVTARLA